MEDSESVDFIIQFSQAAAPFWGLAIQVMFTVVAGCATAILAVMASWQYAHHIRPTLAIRLVEKKTLAGPTMPFLQVKNVGQGPANMHAMHCDRLEFEDVPLQGAHLGPNVLINYPLGGWMERFYEEHQAYWQRFTRWKQDGEVGEKPVDPRKARCAITYSDTRPLWPTRFIQYFYINTKGLNAVPLRCARGTRVDFGEAFPPES